MRGMVRGKGVGTCDHGEGYPVVVAAVSSQWCHCYSMGQLGFANLHWGEEFRHCQRQVLMKWERTRSKASVPAKGIPSRLVKEYLANATF